MSETDLPELKDKRILVVEDEYLLASETAALLSRHGAQVLGPVPSLAQARRLLEQDGYPDAALLDVNLGGEFIWPIVDQLQAAKVPMVLATGYDDDVIGKAYNTLLRCQKPANAQDTIRLLRRALAS